MWLIVILAVLALVTVIAIPVLLKRKRRIAPEMRRRLALGWKNALSLQDASRRVLEAEKVCDQLFLSLGYQGSFGEKLKKAGPMLPNRESVWQAHKLRNRIAHETGFIPSDGEAKRACEAFGAVIGKFL
ncbi:MAG: hypothetical protein WCG83_04470 [Candidatus Peregrinibacteria bacterium]